MKSEIKKSNSMLIKFLNLLGYATGLATPIFEGYINIESDEQLAFSAAYTYYLIEQVLEQVASQARGGGLDIGSFFGVERIELIFNESLPVE